jgi:hypothetical protein
MLTQVLPLSIYPEDTRRQKHGKRQRVALRLTERVLEVRRPCDPVWW